MPLDFFWLELSPFFLTGIVTSISCASSPDLPCCRFIESLLVATRAYAIVFVKRDKLELAFWLLCSVHAVAQLPLDGVVGSRNCRCHSIAAWIADLTVCFSHQTVSALTIGLSRYSAQPTPCYLAYFGQKIGCWRIPFPIVSFASMGFFCHSNTYPA